MCHFDSQGRAPLMQQEIAIHAWRYRHPDLARSPFRSRNRQGDGGLLLVDVHAARLLCLFVPPALPLGCGCTCGKCASWGGLRASFHVTECASAMSLAHQHPFHAIPRRIWLASITALQLPVCTVHTATRFDVATCVSLVGRPRGVVSAHWPGLQGCRCSIDLLQGRQSPAKMCMQHLQACFQSFGVRLGSICGIGAVLNAGCCTGCLQAVFAA
jgi:hypothetical protein